MKTFTQSDMILHIANESMFFSEGDIIIIDRSNDIKDNIIYSTAYLEGVKQLDRQKFVKPDIDMVRESQKYGENAGDRYGSMFHPVAAESFYDGMNEVLSYERDFTREEMFQCFLAGLKSVDKVGSNEHHFDKHIALIRPISLPKSITIQNDEIINVEW